MLGGALDGIAHVAFKPFPIARQGANAVVAFQRLLSKGIDPTRIDAIEVFVPAINVALLNRRRLRPAEPTLQYGPPARGRGFGARCALRS